MRILFSVWERTWKIFLWTEKHVMIVKFSRSGELETSFSIVASLGYLTCSKYMIFRQGKETNSALAKVTPQSRKCTSVSQTYIFKDGDSARLIKPKWTSRCWILRVLTVSIHRVGKDLIWEELKIYTRSLRIYDSLFESKNLSARLTKASKFENLLES